MKIRAAVCYEYDKPLVVEELDLADPRENEVLVKVCGSGICATDISAVRDGFGGRDIPPVVFGHEGAGIVEKVGPGVTEFAPGDHVVVSYPYCNTCRFCKKGKPWFCDNGLTLIHSGFMADGFTPLSKDGQPVHNFFGASTFADHLVSNVKNVVKVDPNVDIELLGPLACGLMTGSGAVLHGIKPEPGSSFVVFGLGGIGQSAVMAAKIAGCTTIIGVDLVDSRLDTALEVGATHVINPNKVDDVPAEIRKITTYGANYAAECSGAEDCVKWAYASMDTDGVVAMVGVSNHVNFDTFFFEIYSHTTKSINMGLAHPKLYIPELVEWYRRGMFPIEKLVKYYTLDQINEAMADSKNGSTIKPIIRF